MEQYIAHPLKACRDPRMVADCVLQEARAITGAFMGNVQLMNWRDGALTIAVQSGFEDEFLNFFRRVRLDGGSVCAQALSRRAEVSVEDVQHDPGCRPYGGIFANAGVCAVHSVPLITEGDALVGMVSVHFPEPVKLSAVQLAAMRDFATLAADKILYLTTEMKSYSELVRSSATALKDAHEALVLADKALGRW
jgi:GAF domain-containing protein